MFSYSKTFSSFSSNDLEKTKEFYTEVLGLEVKKTEMGILEVYTKNNCHFIIYPKPNHVPATFTVFNFNVEDIDIAVDELSAKGVVFEIYGGEIKTDEKGISRNDNGPSIAWFRDPAGNVLSVLESKS